MNSDEMVDVPALLPALEPFVKTEPLDDEPEPRKISAYYSLVFPNYTFYIQTLSITIGRRCNTSHTNASSSSSAPEQTVDVDLGALKSVSRLHAKIEYDSDEDRFVLVVISRNGAWVDGVWSGSGTRAPLGERSQIQISSRIFHFVLPPPPPPEDTPSPSSGSSANRPRSPSVDITSISPPSSPASHSPPPRERKPSLPPPEPQILAPAVPARATKSVNGKKRKKTETVESPPPIPPPETPTPSELPVKPSLTYAQLIYRAIKSIGGKGSLQDICTAIIKDHDYYRHAEGTAWMSTVRHTLSSGRAFKKLERCKGERGKGYFWCLDEAHLHNLESQDTKAQNLASTGGKERSKKGKVPLEPALKRSVKGDSKGPLPPPLTSTPLPFKSSLSTTATVTTASGSAPSHAPMTTGVFSYQSQSRPVHIPPSTSGASGYSGTPLSAPNPYAALTQPHWVLQRGSAIPSFSTISAASPLPVPPVPPSAPITSSTTPSSLQPPQSTPVPTPVSTPAAPATSMTSALPPSTTQPMTRATGSSTPAPSPALPSAASAPTPAPQPGVPDVVIPILLGPIPPTHPDYSPSHPNNSVREGYMILHERTIILCPDIFSALSKEDLSALEKKGARRALQELTGIMVKELKERRAKRKKMRGRGGKPGGPGRKATNGTASASPAPSSRVATSVHVPMNVDSPTPALSGRVESPILIVDDDESDSGPAAKKRKVDFTPLGPSVDVVS